MNTLKRTLLFLCTLLFAGSLFLCIHFIQKNYNQGEKNSAMSLLRIEKRQNLDLTASAQTGRLIF